MDFTHSDEVLEVRRIARDFAENEIRPHVMEWDENQTFPRDVLFKLGELGFLGILIPATYGGAGMGYLEYVAIIEELSRVDGSVGISVAAHNSLCTGHIYTFGTEEQRQRFVVPLAKVKSSAPGVSPNPKPAATQEARARPRGWTAINGYSTDRKPSPHTEPTVTFVSPWPSPDKASGHHGISAFILEKGTPGFSAGKKENKLGLRASDTSTVVFDDCRIPRENLLGELGHGFIDALTVLDGGRISIRSIGAGHGSGRVRIGATVLAATKTVRSDHLCVSRHSIQTRRHGH
jgi:alkylation response protein AidB-like acyl-CoA dehydrogenase